MYVYKQSEWRGRDYAEHDLFTVGCYEPDGKWQPESDWNTRAEAAERAHYLNGGNKTKINQEKHDFSIMRNYEEMTALEFATKFIEICNDRGCHDCPMEEKSCLLKPGDTPDKDTIVDTIKNTDEAYKELFGDKDWRELCT